MNILPTDPWRTSTEEDIDKYFADLDRWNFDVAYSAFYAFSNERLVGEFKEPYIAFAARAKVEKIPACVQIQSTVGYLDTPDLLEAGQYHLDNSPIVYEHYQGLGPTNFFGSYASERWFQYVMNVARILRDYGYEWVVFEEPMYRVDIPGTKDSFYTLFRERYPDLPYPTRRDESLSYLTVQTLKMDVQTEFYRRCCNEARKMGYKKIGIMPWFFTPTYENTPMESWTTCCDLGRMTFLQDLDFIVVRMQPDNVFAEAMVSSGGESLPRLAYLENMSQALGKPTIAVNNPTNEHTAPSGEGLKDLIDYEYFARFTLSAFAAAPSGMSRHWYGKNYDQDVRHMDLYTTCNPFYGRLGGPVSPVAMVFSHYGTIRVMPRPWLETWRSFWTVMEGLLYEHKLPCLTFFADSLAQCIDNHPEVFCLILTPYFPVSQEEVALLESWLKAKPGRSVIYAGGDYGYTHDLNNSIFSGTIRQLPEMVSLCGIDPASFYPLRRDDRVSLEFVGKNTDDAILGQSCVLRTSGTCRVAIKDPKVEILYQEKRLKTPVVTRRQVGTGSYAWYVGLSLDGIEMGPTASKGCEPFPLATLLASLTKGADFPGVIECSPGVLWNQTRGSFLLISNTWEEEGEATLSKTECDYWDCRKEEWLTSERVTIEPLEFAVIRKVPPDSPLLDILNILALTEVVETPEKMTLKGYFGHNLCLVATAPPQEILLNGIPADWEVEAIEIGWGILPTLDDHQEGTLEVIWSEPRTEPVRE